MKYLAKIIILISLVAAQNAFAIDCSKFPKDRYPHSRGGGKVAMGIVTMAVGIPLSLVAGLVVGNANAHCDASRGSDEPYCRDMGSGYRYGFATAGVLTTAAVVGGVSLIRSARPQRQLYRDWKKECYRKQAKRSRGLRFKSLGLGKNSLKTPTLTASFEF